MNVAGNDYYTQVVFLCFEPFLAREKYWNIEYTGYGCLFKIWISLKKLFLTLKIIRTTIVV